MARPSVYFGYNFPFLQDYSVLDFQSDVRLIKNDLLQLLLTGENERVMRNDLGTIIPTTPFEPNDDDTKTRIARSIRRVVERYEPRVTIKAINFISSPDDNLMQADLLCALTLDPNQIFTVSVPLSITTA